jgi:hypothetical protein
MYSEKTTNLETTVSKLMESEDPDETIYVFAWRWKPYLPGLRH